MGTDAHHQREAGMPYSVMHFPSLHGKPRRFHSYAIAQIYALAIKILYWGRVEIVIQDDGMLRDRINPKHPVFGDEYRMLEDDDTIQAGDQTACVSCLLSLDGDKWVEIPKLIGKSVIEALVDDADAMERIFRRKRNKEAPL